MRNGFMIIGKTPDGQMICYAYNDENGKGCNGKCNMLHACRIVGCHGNHPMFEHEGWKKE